MTTGCLNSCQLLRNFSNNFATCSWKSAIYVAWLTPEMTSRCLLYCIGTKCLDSVWWCKSLATILSSFTASNFSTLGSDWVYFKSFYFASYSYFLQQTLLKVTNINHVIPWMLCSLVNSSTTFIKSLFLNSVPLKLCWRPAPTKPFLTSVGAWEN